MNKILPYGITKKQLGDFVRYRRITMGVNQSQLAELSGLSHSLISGIEKKRSESYRSTTLSKITAVFKCTLEDIKNFDFEKEVNVSPKSVLAKKEIISEPQATVSEVVVSGEAKQKKSSWEPFRMNAHVRGRMDDKLAVSSSRRKLPKLKL